VANEEDLVAFALRDTTSHVAEYRRELRMGTPASVDIHHIEHWANGGETAVEQLMLLCSKHHTLVHEGGFRIEKDFQDHWTFFRPDGIAVPDCGYHSRDMLDDDVGEQYENPPRGGLLSAVEKLVNEPPPPQYFH
jgi:hypothetical protein